MTDPEAEALPEDAVKLSPEAQPGVSQPSIRFRLTVLGGLRLDTSGGELLPRRRKELALLGWLACRRMPVLREEAAAAFWGDAGEAHARQSLRQALASIRRAASEALDLSAETIRPRFDALAVDALEMETAFAEGRLTDGLALWTGDFMPRTEELGAEPFRVWLEAERARLRVRVCNAFERVVAAAEGAATRLDWAERWAAAFPLEERAHVYLLGALEHAGRADEALERHGEFAVRYAAEAGIELSASVREMVESIHRSPRRAVAHLPGSAALFTPDITGRDAEIEALEAAWSDARVTGGVAVLIEGARGTGRTRLVTEFARQIRHGGRCVVLEARSASDGDTNSLCRALLAPLASAPGIAACSPAALGNLASELPELRVSRDLPPAGAPVDLAGAVREVVECVAEETPVLVVVDDASHLSREVGSIIARLVRTPPPSVLVLLTAHPGALDDSDCGRALRESTRSRRIKLRPLDANQVEVMIASMIPIAASDRQRLTSILDAETGGNPLQVCECISVFADTGVLALDHNGLWRLSKGRGPASLPLPASMIRTRLEHLSPAARAVAEAAAGTRIRFDSAQLVEATGLADAEVEAALGELVGRRLLRPLRESSAYEFSSDEVRRHVAVPPSPAARSRPRAARPRRRLLLTAMGAVAAVLAILAARTALPASSVARPERVVVLPFANETGIPALDPIGIRAADQLTRDLAGLRRITVAPTPRVDGRREGLDAARAADATLAFSGVMRGVGDSLTLTAELIDVSNGEVSLVLPPVHGPIGGAEGLVQALTDRARAVLAARVDPRIAEAALAGSVPRTYAAWRAFAAGLDQLYARQPSTGAFLEAHALDSSFTLPLVYAGFAYLGERRIASVDSVITLLRRHRELPPFDAAALAYLRASRDGDAIGSYAAARRGAELAPTSIMAALYLPMSAIALNRPREAIAQLDRIDPVREAFSLPAYWSMLSMALHMAGEYDRQLEIGNLVARRLPEDTRGLFYQVRALAALGRVDSLTHVLAEGFLMPAAPAWDAPGLALHILAFDELSAHGQETHARPVLERAVSHYEAAPDSLRRVPRQRLAFGRALLRVGRVAEARTVFGQLEEEQSLQGTTAIVLLGMTGVAAALDGDDVTAAAVDSSLERRRIPGSLGLTTEYRAKIAAVQGRRHDAVRLLRQAVSEGMWYDNNRHLEFELRSLRGYPPFEDWLRVKG